jgi:short-subunit dehydrogenase
MGQDEGSPNTIVVLVGASSVIVRTLAERHASLALAARRGEPLRGVACDIRSVTSTVRPTQGGALNN